MHKNTKFDIIDELHSNIEVNYLTHFPLNHENIASCYSMINQLNSDTLEHSDIDVGISTLLHIRHDLFQILLSEQLNIKTTLGAGITVSEYLGIDDSRLNKTPDILYTSHSIFYMIDPTITNDPESAYQSKMDKYGPITLILKEDYNIDSEVIPICPTPSLVNVEMVIPSFLPWPPSDEMMSSFWDLYRQCEKVLKKLFYLLPPDYIHPPEFRNADVSCLLPEEDLSNIIKRTPEGISNIETTYINFEEFRDQFYKLAEDSDIKTFLEDKLIDKDKYFTYFQQAITSANHADHTYKPSFHIPYVEDYNFSSVKVTEDFGHTISNLNQDQYNSLKVLSMVPEDSGIPGFELAKHIYSQYKEALTSVGDINMFNTNFYTGDIHKDLDLKNSKPPSKPFRSHCLENGLELRTEKPYITKGGIVNSKTPSLFAYDFSKHSGVNYTKHNGPRVYKKPKDCPLNGYEVFQSFYDLISESSQKPLKPDPLLVQQPGPDSETANKIKQESIVQFKEYMNKISRTHCYRMAWHTSRVASSLIHFSMRDTKETEYTLINTGLANIVHICQGGKKNRGSNEGQPFYSIALLPKDSKFISNIFGDYKYLDIPDGRLVVWKWRRLNCDRLAFLMDSYYSVLSTGFDSYLRHTNSTFTDEDMKRIYTFKSLVSQCTTQKVAELLMDIRYLAMSFISEYSDVASLINEKFGPRYPNCFSYWIVKNLMIKCQDLITDYNKPSSIIKKAVFYSGNIRRVESMGGHLELMSIWSGSKINCLQDWFDEIFVYVHTSKEPASQYHEFRKSLQTIFKYQELYDNMAEDWKFGKHDNFDDLKKWILGGNIGCWQDACFHLGKMLEGVNKEKLHISIKKSVYMEPLSEINSTKACIPEYRLVETDYEFKKRKEENYNEIEAYLIGKGLNPKPYKTKLRVLQDVATGTAVIPDKESGRMKVHDCMNDFMVRYPLKRNVLDVANWNMKNNNCRAVADICIKSQYGAKREFYVINFGAKCLLRTVENTFKELAKHLPEEMISCPGDTKLEHMSNITDTALKWSSNGSMPTYFVNGDCTKWSACETMTSFMAMTDGLKDILPEGLYMHCKAAYSIWADKQIQIPNTVIKATKFITEENKYLESGTLYHSTQNFLQGMFNYSSSVKATLATRLAIHLWNTNPSNAGKMLFCKHLEHSDDYVLVIRSQDVSTMLEFRTYHKLMQYLVGIRDSSKKTNIQQHIMEFISLMSFNGQMCYPSIKKTKETGLNIACEGFQQDVMSVVSRVGESCRLGVPLMSTYIQQRIHNLNLYKAYSLCTGMKNEGPYSTSPFSYPTELYGLPDCLPILYVNSFCNVNNYRLLKYGNSSTVNVLKGLYSMSVKYSEELEDLNSIRDFQPLFKPNYISFKTKGLIHKIRGRLPIRFEDYLEYRREKPEYKIMKPNSVLNMIEWTQMQYFSRSFAKAYTTPGRPMLMLRLSFFVTGGCVYLPWKDERVTIRSSFDAILKMITTIKTKVRLSDLTKIITGYNPSVILSFDVLEDSHFSLSRQPPNPQVAIRLPQPMKYLNIKNNLSDLIQYAISPSRFKEDGRLLRSEASLTNDYKILEEAFDIKPSDLADVDLIKLLALVKSQITSSKFGIGYTTTSNFSNLFYLEGWLRHGVHPNKQAYFIPKKDISVQHPISGERIYERSLGRSSTNLSVLLGNLTVMYYLEVVKLNKDISVFKEQIFKLYVKDTTVLQRLSSATEDDTRQLNFHYQRMLGFFKYLLLNDNRELVKLAEGQLGFTYKFLNKWELNKLSEEISVPLNDALVVRHLNEQYFCLRTNDDKIHILCPNPTLTRCSFVYCVSLMLYNVITKYKFKQLISEGTLQVFKETTLPITAQNKVFVKFKNILKHVNYVEGKLENFIILPFEKCKLSNISLTSRYTESMVQPTLNITQASVNVGNMRLFRLPLYVCEPTFIIEGIDYTIEGFEARELYTEGVAWNYLLAKENPELLNIKFTKLNDPINVKPFSYYCKSFSDYLGSVKRIEKIDGTTLDLLDIDKSRKPSSKMTEKEIRDFMLSEGYENITQEEILLVKQFQNEASKEQLLSLDLSSFGLSSKEPEKETPNVQSLSNLLNLSVDILELEQDDEIPATSISEVGENIGSFEKTEDLDNPEWPTRDQILELLKEDEPDHDFSIEEIVAVEREMGIYRNKDKDINISYNDMPINERSELADDLPTRDQILQILQEDEPGHMFSLAEIIAVEREMGIFREEDSQFVLNFTDDTTQITDQLFGKPIKAEIEDKSITDVREMIELEHGIEYFEYDLDEYVQSSSSSDRGSDTEEEDEIEICPAYYQLDEPMKKDPNNYTMSQVSGLINITDYIMMHYTGLTPQYVSSDRRILPEIVKLCVKGEYYKEALSKKELFALNLLNYSLSHSLRYRNDETFYISDNIAATYIDGKFNVSLCVTRDIKSNAEEFATKTNGVIKEYEDGYKVLFGDSSKSIELLLQCRTNLAKKMINSDFKHFIKDLERTCNEKSEFEKLGI